MMRFKGSSIYLKKTPLESGPNILLSLDEKEEEIVFRGNKVVKRNLLQWFLE